MTLGERLEESRGHPAGFDVLRLLLAAAVIVQHSVNVTAGQDAAVRLFFSGWRGMIEPILPMFFALSGFLVAGSLVRCRSLVGFCGLRVLRIVPALAVEIVLAALVLGPMLTTWTLRDYFGAHSFFAYFLNVAGFMHYRLPGLFLHNPDPQTVNAQLWTVPFELECYVVLAALTLLGLSRRRAWFLGLLVAIQVVLAVALLLDPSSALEVTVSGRALVFCFLWGVALFMFRNRIPSSAGLCLLAIALVQVLIWVPGGSAVIAAPIAYATVFFGLSNPPKPALLFSGDYSYGMYLYGFPVQQTAVALFPGMAWYVNAPIALVVAFALAQVSWRAVERRALTLRPVLHRLENGLLNRLPRRITPLLAGGAPAVRASR